MNAPADIAGLRALDAVIEQSERIQETVEHCAEGLASVNDIIKGQLEDGSASSGGGRVAGALVRSESIEGQVKACANELTDVNEALVVEARQRKRLEHELDLSKEQARAARHAALHDPLTGLPNRLLFVDRLDHGLAQAKRHGWALAVMFIDLDRFKAINDLHGHEAGDQVLQMVADRVSNMTRAEDTLCRHGGDEFLYLMLDLKSLENAAAMARRIIEAVRAPLRLEGSANSVEVGCSIGIALRLVSAADGETLTEQADRAMYRAKRERIGVAFYDEALEDETQAA